MTPARLRRAASSCWLGALAGLLSAAALWVHLLPWRLWTAAAPLADRLADATLALAPALVLACGAAAATGALRRPARHDDSTGAAGERS